jgi:hypothetical protein
MAEILTFLKEIKLLPWIAVILIGLLLVKYGSNAIKMVVEDLKDNPFLIVIGLIVIGVIVWIITWFY